MDNYIRNKQVGIEDVRTLAKKFEDYAEEFNRLGIESKAKEDEFELTWKRKIQEGNENKDYDTNYFDLRRKAEIDREVKYSSMKTKVEYTIGYNNGKKMTESGYEWFLSHTEDPKTITYIWISLDVHFWDKKSGIEGMGVSKYITVNVYFQDKEFGTDSTIRYNISTDSIEEENDKIHKMIEDNFYNCPIRYDKVIKNRNLRMQSFAIGVGVVMSYILFIVLKLASGSLPEFFNLMLKTKNVIIFGQWLAAIILGNIFAYWYILLIYKPILPRRSYAGYNRSSRKSVYRDNIEEYIDGSELRIGKYFDADIRRTKIEKLYKIGMIIILVQMLISMLLFLILK